MSDVDSVFRVTLTWDMPESTIAQWVWHYIQTTSGGIQKGPLLTAIHAQVFDAWQIIDEYISTQCQSSLIEMSEYDPILNEFNSVAEEAVTDLDGTDGATDMLPHQEAGLAKFFTSLGRSVGKKFIFGLVESSQADSVLIAAVVTAIALFAAEFDDEVTGGGGTVEPGNFNLVSELFSSWSGSVAANLLLGTQDRRRPGIGV